MLRTATGDKSFAGSCTRVLFLFTAFPHSDDRMLSTAKITLGRKGKADWASTVKSAPRLMERRYGVFQTQRGSVPRSCKTVFAKYASQSLVPVPLLVFALNVNSTLLKESVKRAPRTDTPMRLLHIAVSVHCAPVKFVAH